MKLIELKCPSCGGSLELKEHGYAQCIFCGRIVALEDEPNTSSNSDSAKKDQTQARKIQTSKTPASNISSLKRFILVIGILVLLLGGTFLATTQINKDTEADADGSTSKSAECNRMFLADIFQKDYRSITQEEKNSIKYLNVDVQEGHFIYEYSFHDYSEYSSEEEFRKTTKTWSIDIEGLPWSNDFTDFKGLTRFDYNLAISRLSFSKDCNLKYVTCSGYITNLHESIPVSRIEVLVIEEYGQNFDGIEAFKNLTSLTVNSREITDISKLVNCPNLKKLNLSSDQLTDFGTLSNIAQLEELTLSCNELRTLDFVGGMQSLKSLNILGGSLYDAASLNGLKNLKSLSLDADFESDNFDVIGTLTNLESLAISENTDNMDYLKELRNLKKLKVSGLDDFSLLSTMKNLEDLTLYNCEYHNAYLLSENKKLRSLTINHNFGIDILDLSFLSNVKTLQEIKIYGDEFIPRVCHNFETVFELASLESLRVYGFEITMNPENIKMNKALKTIDLKTVSFNSMDSTGEKKELELSDALEYVKNFPNLEVAAVRSSKLNSIEWVKHLKNLRELDVSDNYISDFSTLNKLSNLERLVCSQNANTNVKLDNDQVEVICIEN